MSLSPREQRILARIEAELDEKDRWFTATFTRAQPASSPWQRIGLSPRHIGLLLLALLVLVVLHQFALLLGVTGMGLLTGALIVPWVVIAARGARKNATAPTERKP